MPRASGNHTHCRSFVFEVYRSNYGDEAISSLVDFRAGLAAFIERSPAMCDLWNSVRPRPLFRQSWCVSAPSEPSADPDVFRKRLATILGSAFRRPVSENLLPSVTVQFGKHMSVMRACLICPMHIRRFIFAPQET